MILYPLSVKKGAIKSKKSAISGWRKAISILCSPAKQINLRSVVMLYLISCWNPCHWVAWFSTWNPISRSCGGMNRIFSYISYTGPEKNDTHPIQQTLYNFLAIYFFVGDFAIFFSASSFKLIKDVSHSSDLVCWWFFRFTEYIWALATGRIVVASFRSIQKLSSLSRLWSRAHHYFLV